MKLKTSVITFVITYLLWIGLNSSVKPDVLIVGGVVSAIIALFFTKSAIFETVTPKSFISCIAFGVTFAVELIKSNLDVALRVASPKLRINPAIVEVKTNLKSKIGRLALTSAITLTPGTLTAEIEDDRVYIHWIDAKSTDIDSATKAIVSKFEKHLEVIFG